MDKNQDTVTAKPIGIRKDGFVIFALSLDGYGQIGPEKAEDLGLLDAGYEFGSWDNYLPVANDEQEEPEETEGFINENQPIRGNLEV